MQLSCFGVELYGQEWFRGAAHFVDGVDVPRFESSAFTGLGCVQETTLIDLPGDALGGRVFPFQLKAVADEEVARGHGIGGHGTDFGQR
jgi:hypothetical protein